jgi:hypothetical protein
MREEVPNTRGVIAGYLVAAGVAAVALPVFVLGFGAPVWMGAIAAVAIFIGGALFAATNPRKALPPGAQASARRIGQGQRAVIEAVMADARPALAQITAIVDSTPKNAIRDRLEKIAELGAKVLDEVDARPERVASVQRLLTYYLPRTADIAKAYGELRLREAADPARYASIEAVLAKTETAFVQFKQQMLDEDMRGLDADLELIDQALKEDLGARR